MSTTVHVRGLEAFGRHGVFPAERELGQRFVVDLDLDLAHDRAADTDDLADTVDYAGLADAVAALVSGPPVALLEHLARTIAARALAEPHVAGVAVTVRKPHVAIPHTVAETAVTHRAGGPLPTRYWLGLGANLGDREAALAGAVAALTHAGLAVEAVSAAFETAPREVTDQPAFLNAACRVRTALPPPEVLRVAKAVEAEMGRVPGPRFGPRACDVDLLLWEAGIWRAPDLEVPHPRLHERRFALLPLIDLDPGLALPDGRTLEALAAAIDPADQPAERRGEVSPR
ncbi:MAG: 2-amino-4-hydroxy-6-hydroxymethyldihydropteridine diphosphokinase [Thermoleophilia bacterium]|jgi:dihydroneopterin aldolase/2-amino-4-hydroxy-6-hydroxymethyldihydropteridine diphosphokinase|nr:2-amino-4-hydroxy-6-hydroxymethyldihydropteridine diphosphokinase [Thermoleophilia bacterium]